MMIDTTTLAYNTMVFAMIGSIANTRTDCVVTAFAPIHHPFTARLTTPSHILTHHSASATALHANLFDRFFLVSKATANSILQRFEDPEKIMTQALEDMQNDLVRVRQTYAEVTATQRRMASSKRQLESQAEDWYNRAQLALKNSNEGLAREALARREALLNQAKSIQDQVDAQASNIDTLYEGIGALEKKIMEAAGKKNQMTARARTAKSTQKINDMLSGLTGQTSMDAFNRMEEKVLALEATAEVAAEMAKTTMNQALLPSSSSSSNKGSSSDIEMQFRMLEASDSVDKELEKLKANILPSSSSSSSSVKSVAARKISVEDL